MIISNLARSLFAEGRIRTTEAKAKRLRPQAERLITFAKRGDVASRRQVLTVVRDKQVVHKLFAEIAPRFADRQGGYIRILKLGPRPGDSAPMALIELVEQGSGEERAVAAAGDASRRRRFGRGRTAAEGGSAPAGANRAERRAAARRHTQEADAALAGEQVDEDAEERPDVPTDAEIEAGVPAAGTDEAAGTGVEASETDDAAGTGEDDLADPAETTRADATEAGTAEATGTSSEAGDAEDRARAEAAEEEAPAAGDDGEDAGKA
jgi:large subunit ribosomal protein L17